MNDFNPSPNAPPPGPSSARLEDALSALVDRYGLSLLNDPDALKSRLDQACGDAPAGTSQLLLALADGVPQQLLAAHSDDEVAVLLPRLVSRLGERDGLDPASARWAVRSWAHALALPAVGLDGPVPRAPAAPPPRAVDFAAIVTPRSDRKPAVGKPLAGTGAVPGVPPSPAVPTGDAAAATGPDARPVTPASSPPEQRPATAAPTAIPRTDVPRLDVSRPDISRPDISRPDISRPDISRPDISRPDISRPDISRPDVPRSDVPRSDVPRSDVPRSDVPRPDIPRPDIPAAAPTVVPRPGIPAAAPTVVPRSGIPAAAPTRPGPDSVPVPRPPAAARGAPVVPPSPTVPIGEASVPLAPRGRPVDPAPAPLSARKPVAATPPDPVAAGGVGRDTSKPSPVSTGKPAAVPRHGIPAAAPGHASPDTVPLKAGANELRPARPLGYLPPVQSVGRSGSKRRAIALGALLVAIAVAGIVIGRSRTSQAPIPTAGLPGPTSGVAADSTTPTPATESSPTAAGALVAERPDVPAANAAADQPVPSGASPAGAVAEPSPAPTVPAVAPRQPDAAPPPAAPTRVPAATKPPVIARIDVPKVPVGKPFAIALVVDPSTIADLATVERRVVDSTIPWPTPVKVTPVSALGRSRSGALLYPVDGIDAASTTTLQFTLIDRKGVRSSPRRVAIRTESAAPAAVAGTCARSTCGSVASVRELEPARAGERTRYEVIIRMDDRTIQTAVMATRPRAGARLQRVGNQFVTAAADRR